MRIGRVATGLAATLLAVTVMAQEPAGLARKGATLAPQPADSLNAADEARHSADQLYAEGRALQEQGDLQSAYGKYREAYWTDTTNFRSIYQGGRILDLSGYLEQAHAAYLHTLVIAPDFYPAWASLGILLAREKHPGDAWEAFQGGTDAAPDYAPAWRNLGRSSAVLGDLKTAEDAYAKAVELEPEDVPSRVTLGLLYAWRWKLAQAKKQFQEALRRQPQNARAQAGLAWVQSQPVGVEQPEKELKPAVPPAPPSMKEPGKEPEWAFRAPEPTIEYSELKTRRGIALTQLGRYDEALKELEAASRYGSQDERVYSSLGFVYYRLGEDAKAARAYKRASELAIVPEPWYHINRGAALQRAGRFGAAAKEYEKAIKIDENSARAYYALGVLRLETSDPRRALKSLVKAVRHDQTYGPAHAALAVALLRIDRKDDAILAYQNAATLMPNDPDVRMSLARLLDDRGRTLEAAEQYLKYAQIVERDRSLKEWRELALRRAQELMGRERKPRSSSPATASLP